MKKTVYIFRHGETEYNKRGIMQGRSIDLSLNKTGLEQTNQFYEYYKNLPFEIAISSELKRSKESIKRFIENGVPHIIDTRITEISWGINEGQPLNQEVKERFKQMIREWANGNLDHCIPEGETGRSLLYRIESFVNDLKNRNENLILINTHGRALKMLVAKMLDQDISQMEKYNHNNTGLYIFVQDGDKFILKKENDISHLN